MRLFPLFWDKFSSDQWIRDAVRGYKIEFKEIQFNTNYLINAFLSRRERMFFSGGWKIVGKGCDETCVF